MNIRGRSNRSHGREFVKRIGTRLESHDNFFFSYGMDFILHRPRRKEANYIRFLQDKTMTQALQAFPVLSGGRTTQKLLWVDVESTGLDFRHDLILELAAIITDRNLEILDHYQVVIHYTPEQLTSLSAWTKRQHVQLLREVQASRIDLVEATSRFLSFLDRHRNGLKFTLAGSSVGFDRDILRFQMPTIVKYIHYRVLDVSTLIELQKRWYPYLRREMPYHSSGHRAKEDVLSSLNLLRFFRDKMFIQPEHTGRWMYS